MESTVKPKFYLQSMDPILQVLYLRGEPPEGFAFVEFSPGNMHISEYIIMSTNQNSRWTLDQI